MQNAGGMLRTGAAAIFHPYRVISKAVGPSSGKAGRPSRDACDGRYYEVIKELPREKDENGRDKIISVGGFIEISGKPDKVSKVKKDDKNLMANINQDVPVLRQLPKHYKVIGYCHSIGMKFFGKKWRDKTILISV